MKHWQTSCSLFYFAIVILKPSSAYLLATLIVSSPSPWIAPFELLGLHQQAEITPTQSMTRSLHERRNHPRTLLVQLDSPPWIKVSTAVYPFSLHSVTTLTGPIHGPHSWAHCSSSWYKRRTPKPHLPSRFRMGGIYQGCIPLLASSMTNLCRTSMTHSCTLLTHLHSLSSKHKRLPQWPRPSLPRFNA